MPIYDIFAESELDAEQGGAVQVPRMRCVHHVDLHGPFAGHLTICRHVAVVDVVPKKFPAPDVEDIWPSVDSAVGKAMEQLGSTHKACIIIMNSIVEPTRRTPNSQHNCWDSR